MRTVPQALRRILAYLTLAFAFVLVAAPSASADPSPLGPGGIPMEPAKGSTNASGCDITLDASKRAAASESLPVNRWQSASNSIHTRLDGKAISDIAQKTQRGFIDSTMMAIGNAELGAATQVVEMASTFCPGDAVGAKIDHTAGEFGRTLFGDQWVWPSLVVVGVIVQQVFKARRAGGFHWGPIMRVAGVLGLTLAMLGGAAKSSSGKVSGSDLNASGTYGTMSPGWILHNTNGIISTIAIGITADIMSDQAAKVAPEQARTDAQTDKSSCVNYINSLNKDFKDSYGTSGAVPMVMNQMWMQTGLRAYTEAQFGTNNVYGWKVNCRALEWNSNTPAVVQALHNTDSGLPNVIQNGAGADKNASSALEKSLFLGQHSDSNQRFDTDLLAAASCSYEGGKWKVAKGWEKGSGKGKGDGIYNDDADNKTPEDKYCEQFYNGSGDDLNEGIDHYVNWQDGTGSIMDGTPPSKSDGYNPRDFIMAFHGYGGIGTSMPAMLYPITGGVVMVVFGGMGLLVFGMKFLLLGALILTYFVLAWSLIKGTEPLLRFGKALLGIMAVSTGFTVLLSIITGMTQMFIELGDVAGVTTSGLGNVIWVALAPLFAVLMFKWFWSKFVKAPDPLSMKGAAGYVRAGTNGAIGGAIAGRMSGMSAGAMAGRAGGFASNRMRSSVGGAGANTSGAFAGANGGRGAAGRRGGLDGAVASGMGAGGMATRGVDTNRDGRVDALDSPDAAAENARGGSSILPDAAFGALLDRQRRATPASIAAQTRQGRQLRREVNGTLAGEDWSAVGRKLGAGKRAVTDAGSALGARGRGAWGVLSKSNSASRIGASKVGMGAKLAGARFGQAGRNGSDAARGAALLAGAGVRTGFNKHVGQRASALGSKVAGSRVGQRVGAGSSAMASTLRTKWNNPNSDFAKTAKWTGRSLSKMGAASGAGAKALAGKAATRFQNSNLNARMANAARNYMEKPLHQQIGIAGKNLAKAGVVGAAAVGMPAAVLAAGAAGGVVAARKARQAKGYMQGGNARRAADLGMYRQGMHAMKQAHASQSGAQEDRIAAANEASSQTRTSLRSPSSSDGRSGQMDSSSPVPTQTLSVDAVKNLPAPRPANTSTNGTPERTGAQPAGGAPTPAPSHADSVKAQQEESARALRESQEEAQRAQRERVTADVSAPSSYVETTPEQRDDASRAALIRARAAASAAGHSPSEPSETPATRRSLREGRASKSSGSGSTPASDIDLPHSYNDNNPFGE